MAEMQEQQENEKKSFGEVLSDSFKELKDTFIAFFESPQALWGVYIPYIIEGLVYFGILTILGKFCSENLGVSDIEAGYIYSFLTAGITFSMLLMGGFSDKLGIRNAMGISLIVMVIGRFLLAYSGTVMSGGGLFSPMFFMIMGGLLLIIVGYGMYQPAAYAAVKKYTTPQTASMGYAVIYGFMNLGAFFSGFISSLTRQGTEKIFPPNGLAGVFWVYVILTVLAVVILYMLITKKSDAEAVKDVREATSAEDLAKEDEEEVETPKVNNLFLMVWLVLSAVSFTAYFLEYFESYLDDVWGILGAITLVGAIYDYLVRRPWHPFRDSRFSFFIFVLIPVQTLFAHNWLTLPYYLDRAFQGSFVGEYFEVFSNLNPILIFIFAPIVAGLTARANVYRMMILGTFVMAIPTFLLAIGPNVYLFLTYVFLMTVGEAMWQPRFLQWIAEIAPKGQTGLYMGVGQFPWFLTKMLTGLYSGYFLEQYCPLDVAPELLNTETMWFIYGLIAVVSPVALVMAKGWMVKGFKEKS